MRTVFIVILLAICPFTVEGQNNNSANLPKHFKYSATIQRSYDRFKDVTALQLSPMLVAGDKNTGLYLSLTSAYDGTNPSSAKRQNYVIGLIAMSDTPLRAKDTMLLSIIDGERLEIGTFEFLGIVRDGVSYISTYSLYGDQKIIAKIAHAKKVEMQFDGIEFEVTDEQRNAIIDFIQYAIGGN
ncbi:MAG: hypothetical protein WCB68_03275 [Pyrinomonadaceae bacterium]